MNSQEVTMNNEPPTSHLIATEKAIQGAADAIALARRVPAPLKSIADQLIRSASAVPANLEEGHGRFGRDRAHHWRIAYASAKEVDVHLRVLCLSGAVPRGKAITTLNLFDEVRAMTWKLLNP
jgi:four helix bundle protein